MAKTTTIDTSRDHNIPLLEREKPCTCGGTMMWGKSCGAYVCSSCDQHDGLARCYCGWSQTDPGRGYQELEELGETIEPEDGGFYDEDY